MGGGTWYLRALDSRVYALDQKMAVRETQQAIQLRERIGVLEERMVKVVKHLELLEKREK